MRETGFARACPARGVAFVTVTVVTSRNHGAKVPLESRNAFCETQQQGDFA